MMQSNGNTVYSKLRNNLKFLKQLGSTSDQVTRTVLLSTLALMKKRIFEQGLNANMRGLGTYSLKYQNKVRGVNGWSNSNVTLELTGEMRREFILAVDNGNWVIGFEGGQGNEAYSYKYNFSGGRKTKNNPSGTSGAKRITTTAPETGKRARLLEKRYGTIFEMSEPEQSDLKKAIEYEVNKRLNG